MLAGFRQDLTRGARPIVSDTLHGGDGADKLDGGLGVDWLYGDNGNDTIYFGGYADHYDGGARSSDRSLRPRQSDQHLGRDHLERSLLRRPGLEQPLDEMGSVRRVLVRHEPHPLPDREPRLQLEHPPGLNPSLRRLSGLNLSVATAT